MEWEFPDQCQWGKVQYDLPEKAHRPADSFTILWVFQLCLYLLMPATHGTSWQHSKSSALLSLKKNSRVFMVLQRFFDIPHVKVELKTFLSRCRFNGTLVMGALVCRQLCHLWCIWYSCRNTGTEPACPLLLSSHPLWDTLELCLSWEVLTARWTEADSQIVGKKCATPHRRGIILVCPENTPSACHLWQLPCWMRPTAVTEVKILKQARQHS